MEKFVLVMPGENFLKVIPKLKAQGIIGDERAFRWYLKVAGIQQKLKVGEYALRPNMTNSEIAALLISGKSVLHKFTVPEGHNKFQIAEALEAMRLGTAKDFLRTIESPEFIRSLSLPTVGMGKALPTSLEGYLYPDTYMLSRTMSSAEIVRMMVKRFKEVYRELAPEFERVATSGSPPLSPHEVVVLASIVEKETGAGKERPLIASVFFNRLRKGMRLQSDPTTIYGMWERDRTFAGNIRRDDLKTETPYNTYTIARLPRGPIANPGRTALEAVLRPAESAFLYFVSRNDGTHVFTTTYKDHNRAVDQLQRNPRGRQGKSWRDLPAAERAN